MTRWPQLQLCRRTSNIAAESPRRVAVVSEAKEEAHLPTESLAGQAARRAVDVAHVHRGRPADEVDVCWMGPWQVGEPVRGRAAVSLYGRVNELLAIGHLVASLGCSLLADGSMLLICSSSRMSSSMMVPRRCQPVRR